MNWPNQVTYNCMTCQAGIFGLPQLSYKGDGFQQAQVNNFTLTSDDNLHHQGIQQKMEKSQLTQIWIGSTSQTVNALPRTKRVQLPSLLSQKKNQVTLQMFIIT